MKNVKWGNRYNMKPFYLWCGVMFPYGMYRGFHSSFEMPNDLLHDKIIHSALNGFMYTTPIGCIKIIHLMARIELLLTKRNPHYYKHLYQEVIYRNMNLI